MRFPRKLSNSSYRLYRFFAGKRDLLAVIVLPLLVCACGSVSEKQLEEQHVRRHPLGSVLDSMIADGPMGWTASLVIAQDTYFPASFSDSAFRKIRIGMSEDEVRSLCGEPLDRFEVYPDPSKVSWRYCKWIGKGNHRQRVVTFTNGRVTFVGSEFWFD